MQLTEKTFLQHALNAYDNPGCVSLVEFTKDLDRFSQIKKQITKYKDSGTGMNINLVLNHMVICFNVFGDKATDFLLLKIPQRNWDILFPFLIALNRLPDKMTASGVQLNNEIISQLRLIIR